MLCANTGELTSISYTQCGFFFFLPILLLTEHLFMYLFIQNPEKEHIYFWPENELEIKSSLAGNSGSYDTEWARSRGCKGSRTY